jgi:hypothetical protein
VAEISEQHLFERHGQSIYGVAPWFSARDSPLTR